MEEAAISGPTRFPLPLLPPGAVLAPHRPPAGVRSLRAASAACCGKRVVYLPAAVFALLGIMRLRCASLAKLEGVSLCGIAFPLRDNHHDCEYHHVCTWLPKAMFASAASFHMRRP